MRIHTSKILTILKSTIIVTLFCFSSTLVHAMEEDEESSTPHRVIPGIEPEVPSILIPSAQPKDKDPIVELQRKLDLARLQRQVAKERRKALAEEKLLAAELSAKIPDAKPSLPPPVDPFVSQLTAFGGGRSQQQVIMIQIETTRFGESITNFLIHGKFKHNKKLKAEKKKQRRAASYFPFVPMTYKDYFKEFLPKLGASCRAYNHFVKSDEEILAILFPDLELPYGTYPDQETATIRFAELARNGKPYAKLFNPPKFLN